MLMLSIVSAQAEANEISAVAQSCSKMRLALVPVKNLRIGDPLRDLLGIEDYGGSHDRAGQRPAASLVNAGHPGEPLTEQRALFAEVRSDPRAGREPQDRIG
jgi:hypothetical protein